MARRRRRTRRRKGLFQRAWPKVSALLFGMIGAYAHGRDGPIFLLIDRLTAREQAQFGLREPGPAARPPGIAPEPATPDRDPKAEPGPLARLFGRDRAEPEPPADPSVRRASAPDTRGRRR